MKLTHAICSGVFLLSVLSQKVFAATIQDSNNKNNVTDISASDKKLETQTSEKDATTVSPLETANKILDDITPKEDTLLEKKILNDKKINDLDNVISMYEINYLLPFSYTSKTYDSVYQGSIPANQQLENAEFQGQFSIEVPLAQDIFDLDWLSVHASYTQLSIWQVYQKSPFFRETNYQPTFFMQLHFHKNWLYSFGLNHQSNGRGGALERSWNRAYGIIQFSGTHWFLKGEAWKPIFVASSQALDNPDIVDYLGHERFTFAYKFWKLTTSLELQNVERMSHGHFKVAASIPLTKKLNLYAQYFQGYGQTLIEYDHFTQAYGLGLSFNSYL